MFGIDVGSTTVKAVVVDPETKEILWSDYQRHQTKQADAHSDRHPTGGIHEWR